MLNLWPTKKQYKSWSMPSKLTFISAYLTMIGIVISGVSAFFGYLNLEKQPNQINYTVDTVSPNGWQVVTLQDGTITKPIFGGDGTMLSKVKIADFDFDGYDDLLLTYGAGGNCCPPSHAIISARGEGYIKVLENDEFSSFSEPKVIQTKDEWLFRITQTSSGIGNTDYEEARVTFAIREGELIEIERLEGKNRPEISAIKELNSNYFKNADYSNDEIISITYDLNQDGVDDKLECGYWMKWGALSCQAIIQNNKYRVAQGCHRIGITNLYKNGYSQLVCDIDNLMYLDKKTNDYRSMDMPDW